MGFAHVESEDRTKQFVEMLTNELHFVETNVQSLVSVGPVLILLVTDRISTGGIAIASVRPSVCLSVRRCTHFKNKPKFYLLKLALDIL